jgi:hypothetical protein
VKLGSTERKDLMTNLIVRNALQEKQKVEAAIGKQKRHAVKIVNPDIIV